MYISYNLAVLSKVHVCAQSLSHVQLFVTPWTAVRQAPLSMGFSRQGYWSGLPYPPPGVLDSGIKPASLMSLALSGEFLPLGSPGKPFILFRSPCNRELTCLEG